MTNPKPKIEFQEEVVEDGFPAFIDLNDPDDTELKLIEWAHHVAMNSKLDETKAIGRVTKIYVPAFCQMLRQEKGRGPKSDLLNGMMNAFASLLAMTIAGCAKQGQADELVNKMVSGLEMCLRSRVNECRQEEDGTAVDVENSKKLNELLRTLLSKGTEQ